MLGPEHAEPVCELLEQNRVRSWNHVAPPAALDALVRERWQHALEEQRQARDDPDRTPSPLHLPHPERWVYTFGVVAYGAQLAGGLMRLLWHALAG